MMRKANTLAKKFYGLMTTLSLLMSGLNHTEKQDLNQLQQL